MFPTGPPWQHGPPPWPPPHGSEHCPAVEPLWSVQAGLLGFGFSALLSGLVSGLGFGFDLALDFWLDFWMDFGFDFDFDFDLAGF